MEENPDFDLNAPLSEISAPVHLAAYYGRCVVLGFLAQKKANLNLAGIRYREGEGDQSRVRGVVRVRFRVRVGVRVRN